MQRKERKMPALRRFLVCVVFILSIVTFPTFAFALNGDIDKVTMTYYKNGTKLYNQRVNHGDTITVDKGEEYSILIYSKNGEAPWEFKLYGSGSNYYEEESNGSFYIFTGLTEEDNYWAGVDTSGNWIIFDVEVGCQTQTYYRDADGDGYGNPSNSTSACSQPSGYVTNNSDCDDTDAKEHPGQTWYKDADGDGYSDSTMNTSSCTRPSGYKISSELTSISGDCKDDNAAVHPGAAEVCNGVDDNCNGSIDEGVKSTYYRDSDGDGYGDPGNTKSECTQPSGYVTNNSDCDDNDVKEHPGQTWYLDGDGDGYSNGTANTSSCTRPSGYKISSELTSISGDCKDDNAAVHPGAAEVCNGVDDNCNGSIDEGVEESTYYRDSDGDGYGDPGNTKSECTQPSGYVTNNSDCNDNDVKEHPGQTWYKDGDGDGYSDATTNTSSCTRPAGYKISSELTSISGDCKDDNAAVHPGAAEVCNGVDDNCNGSIDEGVEESTYYRDSDGDGYGDPGNTKSECIQPSGYVTNNSDCNDNDVKEHPGQTWYKDGDGDGYSDATTNTSSCTRPAGYKISSELTSISGDCKDDNAAVHPGATEVCNEVDDNCNGSIDEGVGSTYYRDSDGDGYGDPGNTQSGCTQPPVYVTNSDDCNDNDAKEHPGQTWYKDLDDDGHSDGTLNSTSCPRPEGYKLESELSSLTGDPDDLDPTVPLIDITQMNFGFSAHKDDGGLKSEIVSFNLTEEPSGKYSAAFNDSEGLPFNFLVEFAGGALFWETDVTGIGKAQGKGAILGSNINGREILLGAERPVMGVLNPNDLTSPDLTGFWSMTWTYAASGWTSDNGRTSDHVGFFADPTGNPHEYQGVFTNTKGTHTVTLKSDGNKVIWNTVGTGVYQSKGTGTYVEAGGSDTILGTFAGKSLSTSDANGRDLGKFYARFTPDPAGEVVVGSPGAWVYTNARFTVPILMDVGTDVLGSYSLKVVFGPDVVNIVEVTGGNTTEFSGAPTVGMNNVDGFVTVTGFQGGTASPAGIVHVANLVFDVVGIPGDATNLAFDTTWQYHDIGDPDFNPIDLTPVSGIVTIAPARVDLGNVSPMEVKTDDTLEVPISIDWGLNQIIRSYDFTISYDPAVFEATTVIGGTTAEFSGAPTFSIDNTLGEVSFNASNASTTSPVGFADVARISLKTISEEGETFLGLEVKDLLNSNSEDLGRYVEAAKVIIGPSGLCGDVNINDRVDIGDAMFIAQYLVGNRDASTLNLDCGDVNANGRVDIGDAMFIAQYLVGNRGCLCVGTGMEVCAP